MTAAARALAAIRALVGQRAEDEGLWFVATPFVGLRRAVQSFAFWLARQEPRMRV